MFFKLDTPTVYASIPEKLVFTLPYFPLTINLPPLHLATLTVDSELHSKLITSQAIIMSSLPPTRYAYSHAFGNVITLRVRVRRLQNTLSSSFIKCMSHANTNRQTEPSERKPAIVQLYTYPRGIYRTRSPKRAFMQKHTLVAMPGGVPRAINRWRRPCWKCRPATSNRPRHVQ